jgi:hypothetical protein
MDHVLAEYYNERDVEFWTREGTWKGRRREGEEE